MKKILFSLLICLSAVIMISFIKGRSTSRDYKVISERNYDTFETRVNTALSEGYQLAGGIAFSNAYYLQAVYR
jgi:hypothetical protein